LNQTEVISSLPIPSLKGTLRFSTHTGVPPSKNAKSLFSPSRPTAPVGNICSSNKHCLILKEQRKTNASR
jgi:hypothetical protein